MRTIACLAASSIIIATTAQPIITSNNIPQIGDISTIGICSDNVDAGALELSAGALQTWDFSGLSEIAEEEFHFVSPDVTPWPNTFTGSDLCGISWDDAYSFYAVNTGFLETIGQALIVPGTPPEDTLTLIYSLDPERVVPLPYTFGDTFTDTFGGTFSAGAFQGTVTGTVAFIADGYGTLILPNGTYTNVVRYHISREQSNAVGGFPATTQSKEQWAWVSSDHRFWLLLMELNDDGFGVEPIVWYDKSPILAGTTSITEATTVPWSMHPNPIAVGRSLSFDLPGERTNLRVTIMDATGRKVLESQLTGTQLVIPPLASGSYLLQVIGPDQRPSRAERLVIH